MVETSLELWVEVRWVVGSVGRGLGWILVFMGHTLGHVSVSLWWVRIAMNIGQGLCESLRGILVGLRGLCVI